jgi:hypothetical protein
MAEQITVGMIDSGLATLGDDFFKIGFFAPNRRELQGTSGQDDDSPTNKHIDDVYGINFNSDNGEFKPYPFGGDIQSHGTKMASLVLGGPVVASEWTGARDKPLVQLKIVNFASATVQGANVSADKLDEAIEYLTQQGALIINMSLSNEQNIHSVSRAIEDNKDQLFVVAAGNAKLGPGRNLDFEPLVFPARYGGARGDHHRNVVTVGAHDTSGQRAIFSNYSTQFVDLLASGCAVDTRNDVGNRIPDNGTSPATAIVSFTSTLIASLGLPEPAQIKNRLLASTVFDPALKESSWSSGRLSVIKAISLRNDVVELNSSEVIFGKIADRVALNRYCDDETVRPTLTRVHKIVPNIPGPQGPEIEYWVESDGLLSKLRCAQAKIAAEDTIGEIDAASGPSLETVRDITFRSFE